MGTWILAYANKKTDYRWVLIECHHCGVFYWAEEPFSWGKTGDNSWLAVRKAQT